MSKANTSGIHIKRKSNVFTGHERIGGKEKSPMKKRKKLLKTKKTTGLPALPISQDGWR